jgi:hypothetical protein
MVGIVPLGHEGPEIRCQLTRTGVRTSWRAITISVANELNFVRNGDAEFQSQQKDPSQRYKIP